MIIRPGINHSGPMLLQNPARVGTSIAGGGLHEKSEIISLYVIKCGDVSIGSSSAIPSISLFKLTGGCNSVHGTSRVRGSWTNSQLSAHSLRRQMCLYSPLMWIIWYTKFPPICIPEHPWPPENELCLRKSLYYIILCHASKVTLNTRCLN